MSLPMAEEVDYRLFDGPLQPKPSCDSFHVGELALWYLMEKGLGHMVTSLQQI